MNAVQERRSHFIFDNDAALELNALLQQQDFAVPTPEVGYRLLPDYGGHDIIEFLLDFKGDIERSNIKYQAVRPILRVIRKWSYQGFPDYDPTFIYQ